MTPTQHGPPDQIGPTAESAADRLLERFAAWRKLHPKLSGLTLEEWWAQRVELDLVLHGDSNWIQEAYRLRDDSAGLNADAGWLAALNTGATINQDTTFRVRFGMEENSGNSNNAGFTLEYRINTGGGFGAWTAVTTGTPVRPATSAQYADGDATSTRLVADGSPSYTAGDGNEDASTANFNVTNTDLDFEFALTLDSGQVNQGDIIELRLVWGGPGTVATYTNTPSITVGTGPVPTTLDQKSFRIRSGDDQLLNADAGWEAALNTSASMAILDRPFRIRFEVGETGGNTGETTGYELRVSIDGGPYTLLQNNNDPWYSATPKYVAEAIISTQYADLDPTTQVIGSGSFTAGHGNEDNTQASIALAAGQATELEWTINLRKMAANLAGTDHIHIPAGTTFDFRVYRAGGTALDAYANTPRVTITDRPGHIGGCEIEGSYYRWIVDKSGNLYYLSEYADLPSGVANVPVMMKSTDGGDTWAPMDEAGAPTLNDLEAGHLVYEASTDLIHILMQGPNTDQVFYWTFACADHATTPDEWVTNQTVETASNPDSQIAALALRSDGTMVGFYGDNDGNERVRYKIRSAGGVWGAENDLDGEASTNINGASIALDDNNDDIHIFYHAWDNTNGEIWHRVLSSSDVLSGRNRVDQTPPINIDGGNRSIPLGNALVWDDGATRYVGILYHDDNVDDLWWNETDVTSIDWTANEQVALSNVQSNSLGSDVVTASAVIDPANADLWVFGTDGSTNYLKYDQRINGVWQGDTQWDPDDDDAVNTRIFTHSSLNGSAKVLGFIHFDLHDIPYTFGGGTGFARYDEIVLAAGSSNVDLNGFGNAASQGSAQLETIADLSGAGHAASQGLGVLRTDANMQGAGAAASQGSAQLQPLANLNGYGQAASAGAGVLRAQNDLTGAGAAASQGLGVLRTDANMEGAGAAASQGSAQLQPLANLVGAGHSSGQGTATLTVGAQVDLNGFGNAAADGLGVLRTDADMQGAGAAASQGSAQLRPLADLSGVGHASSSGLGVLRTDANMEGAGAAASQGSAQLQPLADLIGAGHAASQGLGVLRTDANMEGAGAAASQGLGVLRTDANMEGAGAAASQGSSQLSIAGIKNLEGFGQASAAGSAVLRTDVDLNGFGQAASSGQGFLRGLNNLTGAGHSSGRGAAVLRTLSDLHGAGAASAQGAGQLETDADLNGYGQAASSGLGTLSVEGTTTLNGFGAAASSGAGQLETDADLNGYGQAASSGFGNLSVEGTTNLQGSGHSAAQGQSDLSRDVALSGVGLAASQGAGVLGVSTDLIGVGHAASAGTSSLGVLVSLVGAGHSSGHGIAALRALGDLVGAAGSAASGYANLSADLALVGVGAAAAESSGRLRVGALVESPWAGQPTRADLPDQTTRVTLPTRSGVSLIPPED